MARLWYCLAYATHSRIGDAPTLGPGNEADYEGVRFIQWQPQKKGSAFVSIPMEDILAEELSLHGVRGTYLVTEYGRPFASSGSLDNRVRKWVIAAGLYKLVTNENGEEVKKATRSQHGLRKGVAELMAESGASEFEIMASFGWTEAKQPRSTPKNSNVGAAPPPPLSAWPKRPRKQQVDHGRRIVVHNRT